MTKEKTQPLVIALIGLMLALPVAFLVFRTWAYSPGGESPARPAIEQLEATVKVTPSFDNYINLSVAYTNSRPAGEMPCCAGQSASAQA